MKDNPIEVLRSKALKGEEESDVTKASDSKARIIKSFEVPFVVSGNSYYEVSKKLPNTYISASVKLDIVLTEDENGIVELFADSNGVKVFGYVFKEENKREAEEFYDLVKFYVLTRGTAVFSLPFDQKINCLEQPDYEYNSEIHSLRYFLSSSEYSNKHNGWE